MNKQSINRTYISLFSSAGVGCYGFKVENFNCIATNELLKPRLNIQKANKKCKYESGYIDGDITKQETKDKIFKEIKKWKEIEKIKDVDVVIATPPCQGMSTANYKKKNEIVRNSLVVEALNLVKEISPNIFVFENVSAFLKSFCIDNDNTNDTIENTINKHLAVEYHIFSKVINFKDYGVPSSRPRTIVIGTKKSLRNISPLNLFPVSQKQKTVRDVIGNLPYLEFGEINNDDIYHGFRVYPKYMREWISNIKEGKSAFENDLKYLPYKLVNGKKQVLKGAYLGNKMKRMEWDKPAPCVATRNDQLASQSTIHPTQDRVLSIRELMRVMSIPDSFKWTDEIPLKSADYITKQKYLKHNELNIRRAIGEAVPTEIFKSIAKNINTMLDFEKFMVNDNFDKKDNNFYIDSYLIEKNLTDVKDTGSFYTSQSVVFDTVKHIKLNDEIECIRILEPSVGMGAFVPQVISLLGNKKAIIDLVDTDTLVMQKLQESLKYLNYNKYNITINFINDDFLTHKFNTRYDLVVANPPYFKVGKDKLGLYRKLFNEPKMNNIYGFFIRKIIELTNEFVLIIPKNFIMVPEFNALRKEIEKFGIISIVDYGVDYFKDVFIEIISIHIQKNYKGSLTIANKQLNNIRKVDSGYIIHDKLWLLYRNNFFDEYIKTIKLNSFDFFRDRQLTNKYLLESGKFRVLRSKNIRDNGEIVSKDSYDKYIDCVNDFQVKQYLNSKSILFPNFTYNTRATILPDNTIVNGSIAILINKTAEEISKEDLSEFSTPEFREYYSIVKNKSKFTINLDANSIYYLGVKKV